MKAIELSAKESYSYRSREIGFRCENGEINVFYFNNNACCVVCVCGLLLKK